LCYFLSSLLLTRIVLCSGLYYEFQLTSGQLTTLSLCELNARSKHFYVEAFHSCTTICAPPEKEIAIICVRNSTTLLQQLHYHRTWGSWLRLLRILCCNWIMLSYMVEASNHTRWWITLEPCICAQQQPSTPKTPLTLCHPFCQRMLVRKFCRKTASGEMSRPLLWHRV
jgi:hypothetical protein